MHLKMNKEYHAASSMITGRLITTGRNLARTHWIFLGAVGICCRYIPTRAPGYINDKRKWGGIPARSHLPRKRERSPITFGTTTGHVTVGEHLLIGEPMEESEDVI